MVRIARILRDYREAGSVNGLLALWGFVDETTFLTKAGHVGVVYRVRGVDYEGLTHGQRAAMVHRFEAALRLLDERCRVYQYLLKRTIDPIVAAPCAQPVANEAIQERAASPAPDSRRDRDRRSADQPPRRERGERQGRFLRREDRLHQRDALSV